MEKRAGIDLQLTDRLSAVADALVELNQELDASPPGAADTEQMIAEMRRLQRVCTATLTYLTHAARAHSQAGLCAPPEVLLRVGGSATAARAARDIQRSRIASTFSCIGAAIRAGDVITENIDILARITDRMTHEEIQALSEHDTYLADAACRLGSDSFRKKLQRHRDRIRGDHGKTAADQAACQTTASVSLTRDKGTYRAHALFTPLQGAAVQTALHAETRRLWDQLGNGHGMDSEQIAAQALHDLVVRGANTVPTEDNNRAVIMLNVITDGRTLTEGPHETSVIETLDGVPLSPGNLGQLACDCVIRRVESLPDGNVNVSKSSRTATPAQRTALRALYDSCPISGAPWSQIEVHHVTFVSQGGETVLNDLVPISRRWHHLIHDQGWTLKMEPDRTLHLSRPDGTHHKTIAPPTPVIYQQAIAA